MHPALEYRISCSNGRSSFHSPSSTTAPSLQTETMIELLVVNLAREKWNHWLEGTKVCFFGWTDHCKSRIYLLSQGIELQTSPDVTVLWQVQFYPVLLAQFPQCHARCSFLSVSWDGVQRWWRISISILYHHPSLLLHCLSHLGDWRRGTGCYRGPARS